MVSSLVSWTIGAGGLVRTFFLYASIQVEAIPRWAVLRSNRPAHTSLWSFLSSAPFRSPSGPRLVWDLLGCYYSYYLPTDSAHRPFGK